MSDMDRPAKAPGPHARPGPVDEDAYLAKLRALHAAAWPEGAGRAPVYPFGEIPLSDHLGRWAARDPDRVLYDFYGRAITFAEMDALSDRFAALLQQEGVAPGDPVGVFLGNCPQFVVAFFGILKAGAVHVPINPMFKAEELVYELNDAGAEIVVAQDALVPLLREVQGRTGLRRIFATAAAEMAPESPAWPLPAGLEARPEAAEGAQDLMGALAAAPARPAPVTLDLDAPAALNYTGGTTGLPKGCVHTQRDMIYTAAAYSAAAGGPGPEDVTIGFYPLFWVAGEDLALVFPALTGGRCVLLARWDAEGWMAAVEASRATHAWMLVDNAVEVMAHPRAAAHDLSSLRVTGVSSFVKKLNADFRTRWKALTGAVLAEAAWGMTETHTCDSFTMGFQDEDFDLSRQPVFVGLPVPGTEFKICDFETGALKPLGEEGELCVRSPSLLKSYWNKPEATAEALRGGWLHTGDLGVISEDGFVSFLGRRKEMLKVKGMSVFPAEIEAMLGRHPAVLGSGVVGREDADKGQVPVAFVQLDPARAEGLDAAALEAWCGEVMAGYKRPEVRVVEALPMTATGKVRKEELGKLL